MKKVMKKILIIDNSAHLPPFDFKEFPFVTFRREMRDIGKQKASEIATVFIHKKNEFERDWAINEGISPRFVFGDDIIAVNTIRETVNLPRAVFTQNLLTFLRHYKRHQQIAPSIFTTAAGAAPEEETPTEPEPPLDAERLILRSIRVQGIKSARDTGELAIPNLCVLVGRNGSGKSSLIEALQWLQEASRLGLAEATEKRFRSFRDLCTKGQNRIQVDLRLETKEDHHRLAYSLVVEADERGVPRVFSESCRFKDTEEISTDLVQGDRPRSIRGGNPVQDPDQLALSQVRGSTTEGAPRLLSFLREAVFLRLNPRALAQPGYLKRSGRGPYLDEEGATLPALLDELDESAKATLLGHLQETLQSPIQGVDLERNVLEQTGVLVFSQQLGLPEGPQRLPAWVLSEGTRRLTAIFALLSSPRPPSLLAIEEIENGLDPWTLGYVLDALQNISEDKTSVLLTTHSPFFLDKFKPQNILHVSNQQGQSLYRVISTYQDVIKYEGEIPPGVLYIEGYFRGEP
jgi:predicted ATPase